MEILLEYGMDPNIMDRTRTTPLHVAYVWWISIMWNIFFFNFCIFRIRSLKLSTARLLISYGADQNLVNNRGETAIGLAEYLPIEQRQSFVNVLICKLDFLILLFERYPYILQKLMKRHLTREREVNQSHHHQPIQLHRRFIWVWFICRLKFFCSFLYLYITCIHHCEWMFHSSFFYFSLSLSLLLIIEIKQTKRN